MPMSLSISELAIRLTAALICGLLIGIDREIKRKTVGVRTYVLVCLGSAGFSMVTIEMAMYYLSLDEGIKLDPSRVVQGIVTGIGFLGGGAILHKGEHVAGVATGASIWVAGAIGIACGFGFYWHAALIAFFCFIVLNVFGYARVVLRDDIDSDEKNTSNRGATEKKD